MGLSPDYASYEYDSYGRRRDYYLMAGSNSANHMKSVIAVMQRNGGCVYRYSDGTEQFLPNVLPGPGTQTLRAEHDKIHADDSALGASAGAVLDKPKTVAEKKAPLEWLSGRVEEICSASGLRSQVNPNPKGNSRAKSQRDIETSHGIPPHVTRETRDQYWERLVMQQQRKAMGLSY